ncbi:MAG: HDOD domain-containing protein [Gammaproteobacteria bacterium]|nr:MAG: HDOD domain-containing protein [Gammaproteobacteria bacterium]
MTKHATRDLASDIARSLVNDVSYLVSPPDICVRVFDLIESDTASADEIGEVISSDPSLTARLLRLVNSAYFNLARKVDTVSRAVTLVGIRELYSLILAVSAIRTFSNLSGSLVNMDTFWRHGLFTGLIARNLARRVHVLHPERLFVAGLLHDIGHLVLYTRLPEIMQQILLVSGGDEGLQHQAELSELGFSHADLGGALAETWKLPDALCAAISYHHLPGCATETAAFEAALVHLADVLANRSQIGAFCEKPQPEEPIDPFVWEVLGLDPNDFDEEEIMGEAGIQFTDTASLLLAHA